LQVLPEEPYTEGDPLVEMERSALVETVDRWLASVEGEPGNLPPQVPAAMRYEVLVNFACMTAEITPAQKLELLELDSILERGHRVRELLDRRLKRPPVRREPGGERN
jgi:hypothetical protein